MGSIFEFVNFILMGEEKVMPIYEYYCENCGHFEKMQKINDPVLLNCPACQGSVKRLISSEIGISFKGQGFYCTDSIDKKKQKARKINKERQKDNQALLDGDIKGFNKQSEATDKKISSLE